MQCRLKSCITSALLYAVVMAGLGAVISSYSELYAAFFLFVSVIALAYDRYFKKHLKGGAEGRQMA